MSTAACTSCASPAGTTNGTRMSRPTIRTAPAVMNSPITEAETRHTESQNDLAIVEARHARKRQQSAGPQPAYARAAPAWAGHSPACA
jgi:hypothetical protein